MAEEDKVIEAYGITTNTQLRELADSISIPLNDINYAEALNIDKDGGYIVNLGNDSIGGTHWTALWLENKKAFYFDSFAGPPPDMLVAKLKRLKVHELYYNESYEFQKIDETLCGVWCMVFLHYMNKKKWRGRTLTLCNRFKKMTEQYIDTL
jgi:hypothetical protein